MCTLTPGNLEHALHNLITGSLEETKLLLLTSLLDKAVRASFQLDLNNLPIEEKSVIKE